MSPSIYSPKPDTFDLLESAWNHVQSVPYQVSARWLFYRLLQEGRISTKADYKRIISILSIARKRFYGGWRPDTLADDTRQVVSRGTGYGSVDEWMNAIGETMVHSYIDRWDKAQDHYLLVCFEAGAMDGQFDHYLPPFVPRVAFKGDVSIPAKWKLAKLIERAARTYGLPVVVLYFGDLDPKGLEIPESAMDDVRAWSREPFEYFRGGLNPGQEISLGIPENPERPGTYQWEGLDDDAAGELITSSVSRWIRPEMEEKLQAKDDNRVGAFRDWWIDNKPTAADLGLGEGD